MLGFKFIDTLQEQGLTGPVPVLGIYGGHDHSPVINYQGVFNTSTITAILEVGDTYPDIKFMNTDLINMSNNTLWNSNGLDNSEMINHTNPTETGNDPPPGWSFGGQGGGGTEDIKVEYGTGDDYMESPYTSHPAKRISVIGTNNNKVIYNDFRATSGDIITGSVYISYGNISSSPLGDGSPRTTFKIDDPTDINNGSQANATVIWNTDGTLTLQASGPGLLDKGYDTIEVGSKTWYRIWISSKTSTPLSTGKARLYLWPCGWVNTDPNNGPTYVPSHGFIYTAHFQGESGFNKYHPSLYSATYDGLPNTFQRLPNIIAGQPSSNMVAPVGNKQIIYEADSNKPFTNYTKGVNKIYLSSKDFYEKNLVYRDNDFTGSKVRLLKANHRFHTSFNDIHSEVENPKIYIKDAVTPSMSFKQNINDEFKLHIPIRNNKHSWKIHFKNSYNILGKNIVKVSGGEARPNKVWDEIPKKISNKLFQLSEFGLTRFKYDKGWMTGSGYYMQDQGDVDLLFNYDDDVIKIVDINLERGLILFEQAPPVDLTVSYFLDESWTCIPLELNPLLSDNIPDRIEIKMNPSGRIVYELDGNGILIDNGVEMFELAEVYNLYQTIAIVEMSWDKPEIIDIRREGGMLLEDENTDNYDIDSHMTYGFMGVNPTQLHTVMVRIPDKALENLIYQWEETHPLYNPEAPFSYPLDWDQNREVYIEWISALVSLTGGDNFAKDELLRVVKRCLPIGVPVAVFDKHDNYIGRSA